VSGVRVQPNPVTGGVVEVGYRAGVGGPVRVELVSATGVVVGRVERGVVVGEDVVERLSVEGLSSGVYLVRVVSESGVRVRSVVVAR